MELTQNENLPEDEKIEISVNKNHSLAVLIGFLIVVGAGVLGYYFFK